MYTTNLLAIEVINIIKSIKFLYLKKKVINPRIVQIRFFFTETSYIQIHGYWMQFFL